VSCVRDLPHRVQAIVQRRTAEAEARHAALRRREIERVAAARAREMASETKVKS
jgi:hypothetical protein